MIIVMKHQAAPEELQEVINWIEGQGYRTHLSQGEERTIIGVIGDERPLDANQIERLSGVEKTVAILEPYKLASREMQEKGTLVPLNGLKVGGDQVAVIVTARLLAALYQGENQSSQQHRGIAKPAAILRKKPALLVSHGADRHRCQSGRNHSETPPC